MDEMVRMQSADGKTVTVSFGLLRNSRVIQQMRSLIGSSFAGDKDTDKDKGKIYDLPLHGIKSSEVLLKLLLWAEFHKKDGEPAWVTEVEPITSYQMELQVDDWDKEFLREKIDIVCALMEAADYLDIPWLFKLTAYKIALYCRRFEETTAGLKQYQERIEALAMFDWTVKAEEQDATEKTTFDRELLVINIHWRNAGFRRIFF